MFSRTLTTTLALAGAASALVVPPALVLPKDPMTLAKHAPPPMAAGQPRATVELACPSCPLAVGQVHGHPKGWSTGPDTRLMIEISSDGSQLLFNGNPIYPLAATKGSRRLAAKQEYMDKEDPQAVEKLFSRPLPLSAGIEVHEQVEMLSFDLGAKSLKDLVHRVPMRSMDIEIMGLGEKMIKVDTIRIKFSEDKMQIHDINILPYGATASDAEKKCSTVLCRLRADLATKLAALQGKTKDAPKKQPCAHKHKHEAATWPAPPQAADADAPSAPAGLPIPFHPSFRLKNGKQLDSSILAGLQSGDSAAAAAAAPGDSSSTTSSGRLPNFRGGMDAHFNQAHAHHRASGALAVLQSVGDFLYHIILPVLVGIGAGMLVSGLGMVIGQCVIWTMQKLWGYDEGYDAVEIVFVDDEERFFMDADREDAEFLPKYEEVQEPPPQFDFGGDEKVVVDQQ